MRRYDPDLPAVPVYAAELNQVWTNLVENAAQAMAGTGTLTVTTRRVDDHAEVEVADTGPGIPDDVRPASSSRSSPRSPSARAPGSASTSRGASS